MVNGDLTATEETGPMSREEKRKELFRSQKHTLDLFLERGAISRAQYDKSLGDLILKMGIGHDGDNSPAATPAAPA